MDKKLLNRTQAAIYLGFDRRTLLNWERDGYGPKPIRLPSGSPMYARDVLDAWVAEISEHVSSAG